MIELWQGLVLALIQGLTEFLPISSSAHLLLPSLLLGWPDQGLAFDVAVHFGTLLAVIAYFRQDLLVLVLGLRDALRTGEANAASAEVVFLGIATLPAVLAGLLLSTHMDSLRSVPVLASTTIGFGLLLGYADRRVKRSSVSIVGSWRFALLIGCAQAMALVPGTSRSGITITAGLLLGLSRSGAARFSFLLSIPIIAGAALFKGLELLESSVTADWSLLALGVLCAGVSAYACIAFFLHLIDRIGMQPFVIYRGALGLVLLGLWWR